MRAPGLRTVSATWAPEREAGRVDGRADPGVTVPGELVVDPFTGSGQWASLPHAPGDRFRGMELSVEYAKIARKRIADVAGERAA